MSTYVSRPVRHLRERPVEGETADLLLRLADDADVERVSDAVRDLDGTVAADRGFATLEVRLPQEAVDAVCDLDGLDAVETVDTLAMHLDGAGEDVTY